MTELITKSAEPEAYRDLKFTPSIASQIALNVDIHSLPTARAFQVYTGVLYQAANFETLPETGLNFTAPRVLVTSALYGFVSITDQVAAYRLQAQSNLGQLGKISTWWKHQLKTITLPGMIVDMRSGPYAQFWQPGKDQDHVQVRSLQLVDGHPKVVSHWAKYARGLLAGHLASSQQILSTPHALAEFLRNHPVPQVGHFNLTEVSAKRWQLDLWLDD